MSFFNWATFIFFLGSMTLVGLYRSSRIKEESQYLLADRKTGLFALIATLVMTELNTSTLIAFSSFGYLIGWEALKMPFIFLFGLLFYALVVAKKWKQFNGTSVADYFSERYDTSIGQLVAWVLLVAMLGFSATYVKSLTFIFAPLFPSFSESVLSGILVFSILAMVLRGGLVSIIKTDLFSFIAVLFFFPCLLFFSYHLPAKEVEVSMGSLPNAFVISLTVLTMFSYILAPWYGQKIVSAKSPKVAFVATLVSALLVFLCYSIAILTTILLKEKGFFVANAEGALPELLSCALPTGLKGLGYGILFSVTATTLSGVWSAMVTLMVGKKGTLKKSMALTVFFAFISYFLANVLIERIFNAMILANIPIVALSFALLGGFYWKRSSKEGVIASFTVGTLGGVACYLSMGDLYTWYWALYIVPLIFLSGYLFSLRFNRILIENKS